RVPGDRADGGGSGSLGRRANRGAGFCGRCHPRQFYRDVFGKDGAAVIEIENVVKAYPDTRAVDGVSLVVEPNTICALVGTSGSGKTTLLRMINRLEEPSAGDIRVDGRSIKSVPAYELRRHMGYVIQG